MKDKPTKERHCRSRGTSPINFNEYRSDSKLQKQQTVALKQRISALNKQVSSIIVSYEDVIITIFIIRFLYLNKANHQFKNQKGIYENNMKL